MVEVVASRRDWATNQGAADGAAEQDWLEDGFYQDAIACRDVGWNLVDAPLEVRMDPRKSLYRERRHSHHDKA